MRNWFNWDWVAICVFGLGFAVLLGILIFLVPLGYYHYHNGLGPETSIQPVRFLLDWFGLAGTYGAYFALGSLVGTLLWLLCWLMIAWYAQHVSVNKGMRRLVLDSYTSYVVLVGLLVGFGCVLYLHKTGGLGSFNTLFVAYALFPLLAAVPMFVFWVLLLETWRHFARPVISRQ